MAASDSTPNSGTSPIKDDVIKIYEDGLRTFQTEHVDVWDKLGQHVYKLYRIPHLVTASAKEKDSIISIMHRLSDSRG